MSRTNTLISAVVFTGITLATLIGTKEAIADPAAPASLSVTVENIDTHSGKLMVALYRGEADWKASKVYKGEMATASGDRAEIVFTDVAPGTYGVKMYHDVNGDGELNTGNFGIPKEPYGFSNDAPARFGPASWADAKFELTAGENAQTIHLK